VWTAALGNSLGVALVGADLSRLSCLLASGISVADLVETRRLGNMGCLCLAIEMHGQVDAFGLLRVGSRVRAQCSHTFAGTWERRELFTESLGTAPDDLAKAFGNLRQFRAL